MKVCPNCGKLNDEDIQFCTVCGRGLDEPLDKNRNHNVGQLLNVQMVSDNNTLSVHKNKEKSSSTSKDTSYCYSINFIPVNEDIKFTANPKQNYSKDNTQLYRVMTILSVQFIYFAVVMYLGFDILLLVGIVVSSIAVVYAVNNVWLYRVMAISSILFIYIAVMMYIGVDILIVLVVGISALSLFIISYFLASYLYLLDVPDTFAITNRAIYVINTKRVKAGTRTYPIENIEKIKVELQNVKEYTNSYDEIVTFEIELRNKEILRPIDMHVLSNEDVEILNKIMAIFKEFGNSIKIEERLLKPKPMDKQKY
jgi:hypothetical protein